MKCTCTKTHGICSGRWKGTDHINRAANQTKDLKINTFGIDFYSFLFRQCFLHSQIIINSKWCSFTCRLIISGVFLSVCSNFVRAGAPAQYSSFPLFLREGHLQCPVNYIRVKDLLKWNKKMYFHLHAIISALSFDPINLPLASHVQRGEIRKLFYIPPVFTYVLLI